MENEESNIIISIIFVSIFLVIMLFIVFTIITSLNSGNIQAGQILSGSKFETIENTTTPQTLSVNSLNNPICSIISITDLEGNIIPTSNYTVNNCQVTYNP